MSSDASRVPIEFGARQWGHIDFLEKALKDEKSAKELMRDPIARHEFSRAMFDAIQDRALKAYSEEWGELSPQAIKTLIGRSKTTGKKPTPALANEHNAKLAAEEAMKKLEKGKQVTLVDLGSGGGGTIVPIIDSIPKQHRKNLRVALVDVMPKGLSSTKRKLMRRGLSGKEQVIPIRENLGKIDASKNKKLLDLTGEADIVVSGAALHHVSSIDPTFMGVNRLLKRGGSFIFWDWGHAAWKAPQLIVAPNAAEVDKYGRQYKKGRKTVEAEKGTAFVSRGPVRGVTRGRVPTELEGVREMLSTWISLLHYNPKRKANFLSWFDRKVQRGEPIEYAEYLKHLEGKPIERGMKPSEIKYWEGHRPPELYHDSMKRVGLIADNSKPHTVYPTKNPLLYQMKVKKR
jgi:SAM-dependent methyltransferase